MTVEFSNGSSVEYDPKRIYGVNIYRETSREFATGDRLQFSALNKEVGISNRDMGTIYEDGFRPPNGPDGRQGSPLH